MNIAISRREGFLAPIDPRDPCSRRPMPPTGPEGHHRDGPRTGHALTFDKEQVTGPKQK